MRRFAPLTALALFACEDSSMNENETEPLVTGHSALGSVTGTVFDGAAAPDGEFIVALARDVDDAFTIEATVFVEAEDLPYFYEFQGLEAGIDYRLVAINADLDFDMGQFGVDDLVAGTADIVRIPANDSRVDDVNLAL